MDARTKAILRDAFGVKKRACDCRICEKESWWMVVCPECGNKRCPKATFHGHECTRSNDSGQVGSAYGEVLCGKAKCKCIKLAAQYERERAEIGEIFPQIRQSKS